MKETLKNVDELYDKINQLLKSYDLLKKNNDKIFYQKHITTHILDKTNIEIKLIAAKRKTKNVFNSIKLKY